MRSHLRHAISALRRGKYRFAWLTFAAPFRKLAWPFCRKCGRFGWHGGYPRCWKCQLENLVKCLREEPDAEEEARL